MAGVEGAVAAAALFVLRVVVAAGAALTGGVALTVLSAARLAAVAAAQTAGGAVGLLDEDGEAVGVALLDARNVAFDLSVEFGREAVFDVDIVERLADVVKCEGRFFHDLVPRFRRCAFHRA